MMHAQTSRRYGGRIDAGLRSVKPHALPLRVTRNGIILFSLLHLSSFGVIVCRLPTSEHDSCSIHHQV